MLLSIRQGNGVNGKSIAKPVFFLSIMEAVSDMKLNTNHILCDDINIKNSYARLMGRYEELCKVPFTVPYYHLASSAFYHLIWRTGEIPSFQGHTPSAKYLRENLLYAKLDEELWDLLQDAESRKILKQSITKRYLTK